MKTTVALNETSSASSWLEVQKVLVELKLSDRFGSVEKDAKNASNQQKYAFFCIFIPHLEVVVRFSTESQWAVMLSVQIHNTVSSVSTQTQKWLQKHALGKPKMPTQTHSKATLSKTPLCILNGFLSIPKNSSGLEGGSQPSFANQRCWFQRSPGRDVASAWTKNSIQSRKKIISSHSSSNETKGIFFRRMPRKGIGWKEEVSIFKLIFFPLGFRGCKSTFFLQDRTPFRREKREEYFPGLAGVQGAGNLLERQNRGSLFSSGSQKTPRQASWIKNTKKFDSTGKSSNLFNAMSNSTLVAPGVAASVGLQDHSGTVVGLCGSWNKI